MTSCNVPKVSEVLGVWSRDEMLRVNLDRLTSPWAIVSRHRPAEVRRSSDDAYRPHGTEMIQSNHLRIWSYLTLLAQFAQAMRLTA